MISRKGGFSTVFLTAAVLLSAQVGKAQTHSETQTSAKKGSLIGSTFQGSDEPMNIQPGWEHEEGVPVPKSNAKVSAYGIDHYQRKGQENLFLFVQKVGAKGKVFTWKVLDTLYVGRLDKGKYVEFCATCKMGKKTSNEVYVTIVNKPTKDDKQRGYYTVPFMWLADRTTGKFVPLTTDAVKSYMPQ